MTKKDISRFINFLSHNDALDAFSENIFSGISDNGGACCIDHHEKSIETFLAKHIVKAPCAINYSINWWRTPQGYRYWDRLCLKWISICGQSKQKVYKSIW